MPSRRARKRYRRLATNAGLRGDRKRPPTDDSSFLAGGVGGPLCGDWENASLSDLRLLRHAIYENWPVPLEHRRPLMEAVVSQLHREDDHLAISACQVAITAENHNQRLDERERKNNSRSSKKTVVETCLSVDANRWMREGILQSGVHHAGSWAWFRDEARTEQTSAIGYLVNTRDIPPWVRLFYTVNESKEAIDYQIRLVAIRPRFGGLRWWFICPLVVNGRSCGSRVGKLYLPLGGRYFGCRHCYRLTYTSCRESRKNDNLSRFAAREMGPILCEEQLETGRG